MIYALTLILAISCSSSSPQKTAPSIPADIDREFKELEKLKSFKPYRRIRWQRWRRTIRPRKSRMRRMRPPPPSPSRQQKRSTAPSRIKLEIDQNIEWYCIKHRRPPRQCRKYTEPILNQCTRQNGNQLNRKVVNCIKKKLKLRRR